MSRERVDNNHTYRCQAGNVETREEGWNLVLRLVQLAEPVEASIGDGDSRFLGHVVSMTRDVARRRRVERKHIPRD